MPGETTELEQNKFTEQGNPEGWSVATGTLDTLCTGNTEGIGTLSGPPSRGGGGGAGADSTRGMEWAVDPWVVSATGAARVGKTAFTKRPKAPTSVP